mmetsp:Transcript_4235/g.13233  ORF Transcript_4235/g.13233 Transcript_4235/m.13233 type:complete len:387 (-) Transcript_4235:355-1515(-)
MRCARSSAWRSTSGLKSTSWITTVSAPVRLMPSPPARVESRNRSVDDVPSLNAETMAWRSAMGVWPSSRAVRRPKSSQTSPSRSNSRVHCENNRTRWPAAFKRGSSSRSSRHFADSKSASVVSACSPRRESYSRQISWSAKSSKVSSSANMRSSSCVPKWPLDAQTLAIFRTAASSNLSRRSSNGWFAAFRSAVKRCCAARASDAALAVDERPTTSRYALRCLASNATARMTVALAGKDARTSALMRRRQNGARSARRRATPPSSSNASSTSPNRSVTWHSLKSPGMRKSNRLSRSNGRFMMGVPERMVLEGDFKRRSRFERDASGFLSAWPSSSTTCAQGARRPNHSRSASHASRSHHVYVVSTTSALNTPGSVRISARSAWPPW